MAKMKGRVVGKMVVDGCQVTARVLAPGVFTIHAKGAIGLNGDEVPEGKGLDLSAGMNGGTILFSSRSDVKKRALGY